MYISVLYCFVFCIFGYTYGQFGPFPPNQGPGIFPPPGPQPAPGPFGPGGGFPPNGPNPAIPGGFNPNGPNPVVPGGFNPNGPNPVGPGFNPNRGNIPGNRGVIVGDPWNYGTCYFNETGSNVRGRVDIRQLRTGGPVQMRVHVVGLPPSLMSDTEHGIHVHEYGDLGRGCYAAGPHYDSDSFSFHGSPNNLGTGNSHEGDMGNLRQSNSGVIDADLTLPLMTLSGDTGIVGRAIVLHEGRDDLGRGGNSMSLQTGNAGAPIACCTIGFSDSSNWNNPFIPRTGGFQGTQSNVNNFNQGQTGFNQGQTGFNQGQTGFNQGQTGFNQGQTGFNQGQAGFNQGQTGQTGFNQGFNG
ncbi:hypothetical protein FSP39_010287 [Pinctada imbricata]|uniref:Superoxide dismutase copper/zinc binding domain-containing protein n=1 Tax=Pinctada imbricata TaxID=66713 RepID=A0AA89BWS0_PINIB|nr:hypothetical protein FSP39_010287 [Pinctada imbricata]